MTKGQPYWYELEMTKDMMSVMGGKALRGIMNNFISSRVYSGKMALFLLKNYLEATIKKDDRKALIIVDDFTEKYVKYVTKYLDLINMEYKVWAGAKPEAPLPTVDECTKICEEYKPKVIIAIGGGSVMDTAKMVLIKYEHPEVNLSMIIPFITEIGLRHKIKYLVTIPTTSGTGSEVTQAAVATDVSLNPPKKLEIMSSEICPDITVLDTIFVKDMPPFLTMATGLDVLAHATGSYVSNWGSPIIDALNLTAIKETLKYLPRACKYGAHDMEAREHMQWAALIAGLGFGNTVAGIEHSMGHSFGKIFGVHHGLSVGLFSIYAMGYQAKITDRWIDLCPLFRVEVNGKTRDNLYREFMTAVKDFIRSIDGPICVKDVKQPKIDETKYFSNIDLLSEYSERDALTLTSYRPVNKETYKKIFQYAWDGKNIDF